MSDHCETCKHWQAPDDNEWDTERLGFGVCLACKPVFQLDDAISEEVREGKWCDGEAEKQYAAAMKAIGERELFGCNDGSSYAASFNTHPKFGCVRHQTK